IFSSNTASPKMVDTEVGKPMEIKKKPQDENQISLFGNENTDLFTASQSLFNNLENTEHLYQTVQGDLGIRLLLQNLLQQKTVCVDTETTGLDALNAELVGIAFSYEKGKGYYVPFPENQEEAQTVIEKLRPFFENESIEKVGQNLKYDIKILKRNGIEIKGKLFDTMIAHYLINPDMRHNMDVLSETYLKYSPKSIETLIGKKGKNQKSMRDVEVEQVKEYAVEDTDVTLQLKEVFEPILEQTNTRKLFDEIEIPLVPVLADMESEGVQLDVDYLKTLSSELALDIKTLEMRIYEAAGHSFNLASPKQLGEILFDKLKIGGVKQKKTKTGQYATGEEVLSFFAKDHQIVSDILDWRQLVKLQN